MAKKCQKENFEVNPMGWGVRFDGMKMPLHRCSPKKYVISDFYCALQRRRVQVAGDGWVCPLGRYSLFGARAVCRNVGTEGSENKKRTRTPHLGGNFTGCKERNPDSSPEQHRSGSFSRNPEANQHSRNRT